MRPKRKAISVVISTLILSAAILTILVSALFFSNTVLEQQMDQSEFEQAKNNILTLVDIIEHVAVTPGSSGYVQMNLRTAHPNFINNSGRITVTVGSQTVLDGVTGSLNVGGGRYVGVGTDIEVLLGKDNLIMKNAYDPLGYVYIIQQNGAWLIMNYARVKASYMGVFMFYQKNGQYNNINRSIVRISFINITFGTIRFFGTGTLNLVARNNRTIVQTYRIIGSEVSINVHFMDPAGPDRSEIFTMGPYPPATETIVYVVRMDVEISSL